MQQRTQYRVGQLDRIVVADATGEPVGPVDAPHHRFRRRPIGCPVGPAVRRRRVPQRLAQPAKNSHQRGHGGGIQVQRPRAGDHQLLRRLEFCARLPRRRQRGQRHRRRAQIAVRVAQHALDLPHRVRRRIVGDELPDQLGGEEPVRRRMVGQEVQCRHAAGLIGREGPPHQHRRAGLVRRAAEQEAGRFGAQVHRPAGQDAGEIGHIGLSVAGGRADGVQFHAFARQVLVQAAVAALAGHAVRPDRPGILQIQQHRRMAHHGQQHRLEPLGDVGADRLFDERADQRGAAALADRDGEVVGPEPHQPLTERCRCGEGVVELRLRVGVEHRA